MQWLRLKGCHVACDEWTSGEICSLQHIWVNGSVMWAAASDESLKFGVQARLADFHELTAREITGFDCISFFHRPWCPCSHWLSVCLHAGGLMMCVQDLALCEEAEHTTVQAEQGAPPSPSQVDSTPGRSGGMGEIGKKPWLGHTSVSAGWADCYVMFVWVSCVDWIPWVNLSRVIGRCYIIVMVSVKYSSLLI